MRPVPKSALKSAVTHVNTQPVPAGKTISDADILVVGGRGLQKEADLDMIRELAALLGGDWAVSRPLVEKGWATNARQIACPAHGAPAADHHLRGERGDSVCSLHERQRTYRGDQQRRAGADF